METVRSARVAYTWQWCFCVLLASAGSASFVLGGTPAHQALQGKGGGQEAAIVLASLPKPLAPTQSRFVSPPPGASQDWLAKVQETIREEEYHITWSDHTDLPDLPSAYQAPNRAQGFRAYFTDKGIRIVPRAGETPGWEWELGVHTSSPHKPLISVGRVEYRISQVSLTAENTPRGLALKWVINKAPEEEAANPGLNTLAVVPSGGSLVPTPADDGQSLDLRQPSGGMAALHLGSLHATDAGGRSLRVVLSGSKSGRSGLALATPEKNPAFPVTIEALVTGPSWTAESDQAGATFGRRVGPAGDVNGDGYSDVFVGAPDYDNGQSNEGRAFVFYGSPSGPSAIADWTAEINQDSAAFGISGGTAGDVNGDGFGDLIIGALYYMNGEWQEGAAFVYLGSSSGLASSYSWMNEGNQPTAWYGYACGAAGDVNGDGYGDIIVGACGMSNGQTREGRAYVYFGSASSIQSTPVWTAESDVNGAYFGECVATAGDINGDGYSEIIVGSRLFSNGNSNEGAAMVYLGSSSGPLAPATWVVEGNQDGAQFGSWVGPAGDTNGDGYADIIVGAEYYDNGEADEGRAFVYLGSASGLGTVAAWTAESDQASAQFGSAVMTAGDINGDGYSDVVVSAPFYDNGETDEGRVYLYFGSVSGLATTAAWMAEGDQAFANFGQQAAATAGDVNGDGYSDLIVGAWWYDNGQTNEGRAYVFFGGPDGPSTAAGWTAEGTASSEGLGSSVSTAGDVNGDGYSDAIVGAPGYSSNTGKAYLFLGGISGLSPTASWTAVGESPNSYFGSPVASAGDVNGDGYADVVIGAASYNTYTGRAYLYMGGASGLSADPSWTATGPRTYSYLGWSVATAGDVNGDGYSDVIVGAGQRDTSYPGTAYLFLGGATGLSTTADWTALGESGNNAFGESVATAGDVNGDGYSDVVIGADRYSGVTGKAYLFLGGASGLSNTSAWTATGESSFNVFGSTVASAGDVNGDGYSDVAVAALGYNSEAGKVYLYLGGAAGLSGTSSWTAAGDVSGALFGRSLASAGDVNGDGYSDVVVGEEYYLSKTGRAHLFLGGPSGLSTTASWLAVGENTGDSFGYASAAAGDVNGDGFSDVVVGGYNNNAIKGKAYLYYGGGGRGLSLTPQQRRYDDSVPIAHLGRSDDRDGFRLAAVGRSPFGRGKVRLQTEVKPFGTALNGTDLQTTAAWTDSGLAGTALTNVVDFLEIVGGYHWRARILYDPVTLPFQVAGRWFGPPVNGWEEMDLIMVAEADLRVTSFSDSPDPVNNSQNLTYSLTVENDGPDSADGVTATLVLTHPGISVSFIGGSSDLRWSWDSGTSTLSADLGTMADGASTTLDAVFTVSGSGSLSADAAVSSSLGDPDGGNNAATVSTTIAPSADLAITAFTDTPDPVLVGDSLTYTLSFINNGPDASAVTATETFTPTGMTLTLVPGSSDGRWTWDSGTNTLTAALGSMANGATDSLAAVFTASAPGTIAAHAVLTPSLFDPNPANNEADVSTTSCVIPGAFGLLHPASGVVNLSTSAVFYWQPSTGAVTYDLRLGTTTPPPLHTSGIAGTETAVTGLIPGATYYWDIEARTPCGTTLSTGGPRSFTTACPTELGRWPDKPYGTVRSSVISGNYAYYGNGLVLTVLDISDPANPVLVKEIPLPGEVDEGEPLVESGYLFLPLTNGTLKIYDLADPESPAEIASLEALRVSVAEWNFTAGSCIWPTRLRASGS